MTDRGAVLAVSVLAALVSALPAVPRVSEAGGKAAFGLIALWGGTALVLGPAMVLSAAARDGRSSLRTVLVGLALAAAPLSLLAEGLKLGTHHRPLGAATYAVLALATIAGAILAAWQLLRFSESRSPRVSRAVGISTVLVATASVGFVLVRALGSPSLVPHVLDGLRAIAAATLAYLFVLRFERAASVLRRVGVPLWAFVVVAGFVAYSGPTGLAIRSAAPVLGGPAAWF